MIWKVLYIYKGRESYFIVRSLELFTKYSVFKYQKDEQTPPEKICNPNLVSWKEILRFQSDML